MKLLDLDPRWTGVRLDINRIEYEFPHPFFAIGLSFLCPNCRSERLAVQFKPPIDPAGILPTLTKDPWDTARKTWGRTGDAFDDLTLAPSIDAGEVGHWHGFITNGEIVGGI